MKSKEFIEFEIDNQIKNLKTKGVEPKFLMMGDTSYFCLKEANKHNLVKIPNEGTFLRFYKGLTVIVNPYWSIGGMVRDENENVEVVGV